MCVTQQRIPPPTHRQTYTSDRCHNTHSTQPKLQNTPHSQAKPSRKSISAKTAQSENSNRSVLLRGSVILVSIKVNPSRYFYPIDIYHSRGCSLENSSNGGFILRLYTAYLGCCQRVSIPSTHIVLITRISAASSSYSLISLGSAMTG